MTAAAELGEPEEFVPASPKKKRPPKKKAAEPLREVNLLESLPKPKDLEKKSPYPEGVAYFSYQPKDGSDPILLAINGFERPDKLWFFDLSQLPPLASTWAWMNQAKVPKDIQRRAQMLPDAEYFGMFDEWFEVMKAAQGPKGSLTVGK